MKTQSKPNIGCIIQARMNSNRLPGKIIKSLMDKPVLEHIVERIRLAKNISSVTVATTTGRLDDQVEKLCTARHIAFSRGSEHDVLARYYETSKKAKLDVVIRVSADCPLIDPHIIDQLVECYLSNQYDFVANVHPDISQRTFPRGMDAEVFGFTLLEEAYQKAKEDYQKEHVTPYMYEHAKRQLCLKNQKDYSFYRLTLDTPEDWRVIEIVYKDLYKGRHDFFLKEIVGYLEKHPDVKDINRGVQQKAVR